MESCNAEGSPLTEAGLLLPLLMVPPALFDQSDESQASQEASYSPVLLCDYKTIHGALAQVVYILTSEKLEWRDPHFGTIAHLKIEPIGKDSLFLLPLESSMDNQAKEKQIAKNSLLLPSSLPATVTSAAECARSLILWQWLEPLLRATLIGDDICASPYLVAKPESGNGQERDEKWRQSLSNIKSLVDRLLVGIPPLPRQAFELSQVAAYLRGNSDPSPGWFMDEHKAVLQLAARSLDMDLLGPLLLLQKSDGGGFEPLATIERRKEVVALLPSVGLGSSSIVAKAHIGLFYLSTQTRSPLDAVNSSMNEDRGEQEVEAQESC